MGLMLTMALISIRAVLHFNKNELPPVRGFWSLSMYDHEMYFVDNPIRRYAIDGRDKLQFIKMARWISTSSMNPLPGKDKEANWLPAPNEYISYSQKVSHDF
jgi:hypothetical protein